MDAGDFAVSILGGLLSGAGVLTVYSFLAGRKYQKIEDKLEHHERRIEEVNTDCAKKDAELETKIQKVDEELDATTKENNESWQYINRSLGQIEGMLSGGLPPPPPRPPTKTRP